MSSERIWLACVTEALDAHYLVQMDTAETLAHFIRAVYAMNPADRTLGRIFRSGGPEFAEHELRQVDRATRLLEDADLWPHRDQPLHALPLLDRSVLAITCKRLA
jgi:23S rRNA A2030 N6-methylase RlmJ